MKRLIKFLVVASFTIFIAASLNAQEPPHPGGGDPPGGGDTPVGGGAPIDGGIGLLMVLASAYGAKKTFKLKK